MCSFIIFTYWYCVKQSQKGKLSTNFSNILKKQVKRTIIFNIVGCSSEKLLKIYFSTKSEVLFFGDFIIFYYIIFYFIYQRPEYYGYTQPVSLMLFFKSVKNNISETSCVTLVLCFSPLPCYFHIKIIQSTRLLHTIYIYIYIYIYIIYIKYIY